MSTHPEDPPSTPTAPRISVEPESHTHPSPATQGRSPTPQHQHTPQVEDLDLRLNRARNSQGQPLSQYQETPLDPASPEREEQWFHDPGHPKDRGGCANPKPWSYGTPKNSAPTTTSTPQTAPRLERPPTPQTTPTLTCTATPDTAPGGKGPAETPATPEEATPSLQEIWLKSVGSSKLRK